MNCSCISDIEKRIGTQFAEQHGKPAHVECAAVGFTLGKSLDIVHKTDFKITADVPGYKRGNKLAMIASFCPFCGKSTKKEPTAP